MKQILYTIIVLALAGTVTAQEYKVSHSGGKIILAGLDEVTVEGVSGSEIIIQGDIDKDSDDYERAKGLKAVNSLGLDDNTDMGLSVVKKDGNVVVTQIGKCQCHDGKGYTIKLPASMGVDYSHSTYNAEQVNIANVSGEIVISTSYGDLNLSDVTGPMSIKTVYGDIEAVFSKLNQTNSVSLNSVYGLVDVALPASSTANLSLRTPYGQIYTDMDIKVDTNEGGMRELSQKRISGTINGGGVDLIVKSGYENIYLRKK